MGYPLFRQLLADRVIFNLYLFFAGERPNIYSSDEDASDIETRRARRLDKAKALKDSDDDDDDSADDGGGASRGSNTDNDDV